GRTRWPSAVSAWSWPTRWTVGASGRRASRCTTSPARPSHARSPSSTCRAPARAAPTPPLDDQFPVLVALARPDRPAAVGRWWLPGTQEGDGSPPPVRHEVFDAGFRAHNINVCAARPDRAYVGYLDAGAVILDISDAGSPAMVSRLDYHPPMPGFTHTVLPLPRSNLLAISDESVHAAAADYPKLVWLA